MRLASLGLFGVAIATGVGAQRVDTTVRRVGEPLHRGIATLVEDFTLGNGRDADEYRFTNAFVFGGRQGTIFVVDIQDPGSVGNFSSTVRQYDAAGKVIRTIGRIGRGPGEFIGGVGDVKELPDGRILLSDHLGILVYSPTGASLDRWPAKARAGNIGSPLYVDPAGFVYSGGAKPPSREQYTPPGARSIPFLFRFRLDGRLVDSVSPPEAFFQPGPRVDLLPVPFAPGEVSRWSPTGYFVTANSSAYSVDLHLPRAAGVPWSRTDPVVSLRRSVPAVPVAAAERDDWHESITAYIRSVRRNPSWQWSGPEIPRVKPPLKDLFVDRDGRIWARLAQPANPDRAVAIRANPTTIEGGHEIDAKWRWIEPSVYDVIEPSGRYIGQVRFPKELGDSRHPNGGFVIQGDTVWAVTYDQDDVGTVKRYRIRWGG